MSTNTYDYQVGSYQLPSYTMTYCSDCKRAATYRLTVNRVEKHGVLIADSFRDYCDAHIDAVVAAARLVCQARLYGENGQQSGQSKGAA